MREFYGNWIKEKVPPTVRPSLTRDYQNHFRNYILEVLGDVALPSLSIAHLEDLRSRLRRRGLAEKTIRNAIDGSFRSMVRDARDAEIVAGFPFLKIQMAREDCSRTVSIHSR